jgi:hypothetical protein
VPRIFVSQQRVHQWTEEGRVSVEGNIMNLPELGRTFRLTEAFFVERVVSEGGDPFKLTGRVKTRSQIAALGGEVFLNSLIIGDAAYEGDPGFVGEALAAAVQMAGKVASSPPAPPVPPAPAAKAIRRDAPSRQGQAPVVSGTISTSSRDKPSLLGVGPEVPRKNS